MSFEVMLMLKAEESYSPLLTRSPLSEREGFFVLSFEVTVTVRKYGQVPSLVERVAERSKVG